MLAPRRNSRRVKTAPSSPASDRGSSTTTVSYSALAFSRPSDPRPNEPVPSSWEQLSRFADNLAFSVVDLSSAIGSLTSTAFLLRLPSDLPSSASSPEHARSSPSPSSKRGDSAEPPAALSALDPAIKPLSAPNLAFLNQIRGDNKKSLIEAVFDARQLDKFSFLLSLGVDPFQSSSPLPAKILQDNPSEPVSPGLVPYKLLYLESLKRHFKRLKKDEHYEIQLRTLHLQATLSRAEIIAARKKYKQAIRAEINQQLLDVTHLSLRACGLAKVPSGVFLLSSLVSLDLSENKLTQISDSVSYLRKLQHLDLSNNVNIQYLPVSIGFLNEPESNPLKRLWLAGCSLSHIPESVKWEFISSNSSTVTAYHIIPYLQFLREESKFKTLKLMFLGQEGVGKTSLIRSLTGFDFGTLGPSGDTLSTEGIDICEWKVADVCFSVWDFGGQAVFYPTHQFFITNRSVYVLVFDLSSPLSESRIDYWLKKIQIMTSDRDKTPTLLVGTHADAEGMTKAKIDAILKKLNAKYSRNRFPIVDVLAVTTKKKRGVKCVKKALAKIAKEKRLQIFGTSGWRQVQSSVNKLKKSRPYMAVTEFYELACGPHGISSIDLRITLRSLHEAGIVVYFDDVEMGLDKLVILDPEWLSKLMASLVTFSNSYAEKGFLQRSHLRHIWIGYPRAIWPVLLALLERFEIAYPWQCDGESRLIIPSLLPPTSPPNFAELWPPHPQFGFHEYGRIYQFQFVPLGFFSRLMMRLIRTVGIQVHGAACWSSGVLLRFRNDLAYISADEKDFRLNISIRQANKISATDATDTASIYEDATHYLLEEDAASPSSPSSPPALTGSSTASLPASVASASSSAIATTSSSCPIATTTLAPTHYTPPDPNFMRTIVEILEPLLEYSYPNLAPTTIRSIPCIHCLALTSQARDTAFMFSYEECVAAVSSGNHVLYCCNLPSRPVLIDSLAPDLTFSDIAVIDDYTIEKVIGTGGFGTVYKAHMNNTSKLLAVKELNLEVADVSDEERSQKFNEFQREAYIMSTLDSPYIVRLYGVTIHPKLRMVMEYVPGNDLYHYIHDASVSDQAFPWSQRLVIATDIARGMEYLHSRNPPIAHADLRSPNVFLSIKHSRRSRRVKAIRAKVADFGLSRRVFNYTQGMLNTWQWMAPEVLNVFETKFDERLDIYSFAIVIWELITRQFPFEEFTEFMSKVVDSDGVEHGVLKEREIKTAIVHQGLRPTIPASADPDVAALIKACWQVVPENRPSFSQIRSSLEALHVTAPSKLSHSSQDWISTAATPSSDHPSSSMPSIVLPSSLPQASLTVALSSAPLSAVMDPRGYIWTISDADAKVHVANHSETASLPLPGRPAALCVVRDTVWVSTANERILIFAARQRELTPELIREIELPMLIQSMLWVVPSAVAEQDSVWLLSPSQSIVAVALPDSLSISSSFMLDPEPIMAIQHRDQVWIATASLIAIHHPTTGERILHLPFSSNGGITTLVDQDDLVWGGCADGSLHVWNSRGQLVRSLRAAPTAIQTLCPTGARLWVGTKDSFIYVVDVEHFSPLFELPLQGGQTTVAIFKAKRASDTVCTVLNNSLVHWQDQSHLIEFNLPSANWSKRRPEGSSQLDSAILLNVKKTSSKSGWFKKKSPRSPRK